MTSGLQKLHQKFIDHGITIQLKPPIFIENNSTDATKQKIGELILASKHCPICPAEQKGKSYAFTVSPYALPEKYFTCQEILSLMQNVLFKGTAGRFADDTWERLNNTRALIAPALNKALAEIIARYAIADQPIVEIGSGIGYTLPKDLADRLIPIQPAASECQLLINSGTSPVFLASVADLHGCLSDSPKRLPLLFALNVFDTMQPGEREANLHRLSELQWSGDKLLIMQDVEPHVDGLLSYLKEKYPNHTIYPYIPDTAYAKYSLIVVPTKLVKPGYELTERFDDAIDREINASNAGKITANQKWLKQIEKEHELKVFSYDQVYFEMTKNALHKAGYTSEHYCHVAFEPGKRSPQLPAFEHGAYKSVVNLAVVQVWSFKDSAFRKFLAAKQLQMPEHFTEDMLNKLLIQGQIMTAAEVLVVEATKI